VSVLLLDASVWLAALDRDDRFHDSSSAIVRTAFEAPVAALDLTLYEVANVALVWWRDRGAAERLLDLVVTASGERLVRVDGELAGAAVSVAAEAGLTVYDAAYVACARRDGWSLVSGDLRNLVRPGYATTPDDAVATR
jgi:predicted nucleic acid-binding protein